MYLISLINNNDVQRVREELDVQHFRDANGCTLLHFAKSVEMFDLLIEKGVDPYVKDNRNYSPLDLLFACIPFIPLFSPLAFRMMECMYDLPEDSIYVTDVAFAAQILVLISTI